MIPDTMKAVEIAAPGAAERHQHVVRRIIAFGDRHFANRPGHRGIGDFDKALGEIVGREPTAHRRDGDFVAKVGQATCDDLVIQRPDRVSSHFDDGTLPAAWLPTVNPGAVTLEQPATRPAARPQAAKETRRD